MRNRKTRALRFLGLALVLALALATLVGPVGVMRSLGASVREIRSSVATQDILDWPQVQRDPQRTGYTPEVLGTNFQVAWTYPFQPEKVHPQVQTIVYEGKVFVGTEMGNMYALDAQTGEKEWTYHVGLPILNSAAAGEGKVFFGVMDGAVYALDVTTGSLAWKSQLSWRIGFSTAPVLAENKVMLGGRNGVFYALDPDTGSTLWEYNVGSPLLQTAAWNNGKVYFGAMDMYVYALSTTDGSLTWKSARIPGMAFKDYWPVVFEGKVFIRPMGRGGIGAGFPFTWFGSDSDWEWLRVNGPAIAEGRLSDISEAMAAQDAAMADYQANPDNYTKNLYILDETTGQEVFAVPHWTAQTMNGATTPPCMGWDGTLVVPISFIRSGWGRLDLTTQRIIDVLYDHTDQYGGTMDTGDVPAGMGNADETLNVTCTDNLILAIHTNRAVGYANYTGAFDLVNRTWIRIYSGNSSMHMSTNTQGGGGSPASIVNINATHMIYHISWHELIAREARQ